MSEHGPEALQRGGRDRHPELWEVPLDERSHERAPPLVSLALGSGQERAGESPPQPETLGPSRSDVLEREAAELVVGDAAGEGLRGLAQQVGRGAAEDEEAGGVPGPVGEHAEQGEEIRPPLDLVDDDETPQGLEREAGVGEPGDVGGILEVEEGGRSPTALHDVAGQSGLADLARAQDPHDRVAQQQASNPLDVAAPGEVHTSHFRLLVSTFQCRSARADGVVISGRPGARSAAAVHPCGQAALHANGTRRRNGETPRSADPPPGQVIGRVGGAGRDRTGDLVNAIHARSQLRYSPTEAE